MIKKLNLYVTVTSDVFLIFFKVILEIGCGLRVPSIRKRCEEVYAACSKDCPSQVDFIRINPDYPDNKILKSPSISIKETCLTALQNIQKEIK